MNEQCSMPGQHGHGPMCTKRFSWSAIFSGALVAIGLSFLLNLFSIAIGLSVIKTTPEGAMALATGGYIGLLIGGIVAMFTAGFVSGYLGRWYTPKRNIGALYGFTMWCLALLFTVIFAAQIGNYVTRYTYFISNPSSKMMMHKGPMSMMRHMNKNTSTTGADTQNTLRTKAISAVSNKISGDTNTLSNMALLVFIIFFTGALASALGGHYGMTCCCRSDENCET